jgi:putative glutamine amidotransferase
MPVRADRPLIGVSSSELREARSTRPVDQGEPRQHEIALSLTYPEALDRGRGLPVILPPIEPDGVPDLVSRLSGLMLSGGPDIHPSAYGAAVDPHLGPTEPELDHFELALVREADARGMPILAICRGMQALNIVRGGTLHQHLPDVTGDKIEHRQTDPGERPTHWISLAPRSDLARTLGRTRAKVNSFHHQAIDQLGEGLRESAWAADGTIEAVEDPRRAFVCAVQWHAESLAHRPEQAAMFAAFVAACRAYERSARSLARAA